jgi:hypothetical protein
LLVGEGDKRQRVWSFRRGIVWNDADTVAIAEVEKSKE